MSFSFNSFLKNQMLIAKATLLVLFTFLTFTESADPKCTKITKCASKDYIATDPNQCIYYHSQNSETQNGTLYDIFEYDKNKCKPGFACQLPNQKQNYTCIQTEQLSNLIPGSACNSGKECASSECNNGVCAGKPLNGTCVNALGAANHNACNLGLYCAQVINSNSFTCQPQKNEGDDCDNFFACKNNLVCNYLKCVKAFSLPVGDAADENLACTTKTIFYSDSDKKSYCADFKLNSTNATDCNFIYSYNNNNIQKTVQTQCTETEDKGSYCPLPSDSEEWKEMISTLNTFMNSKDFMNAHATFKKDFGNLDKSLNKKIQPVLQYPKFKGADECIIQLYLDAGFARVGLLVIILSLFGVFA